MTAELGLAGARPMAPGAAARGRSRDHRFFTGMAIAMLLTVFVGFAPTYYLGAAFGAGQLPTLLHVHGAVATAWMLLFLTQATLVSAGRTDLHRTCLFVVACMVYDRLAHGRVHPAFLWGGLFVMVALPARFAFGRTDAWLAVARWLTA